MIKNISDIYIFSDVDKTLFSSACGFPAKNLEVINDFVKKGGHFAIATGRSLQAAKEVTDAIDINCPCILCNGSAIYDYKLKKYLQKEYLPEKSKEYVKMILNDYPDIGIAAVTDNGYYYIADTSKRQTKFFVDVKFQNDTIDTITEPIYKFVLTVPENECIKILNELKSKNYNGVTFSTSTSFYIDMLPENVSKGIAIKTLSKIINVPLEYMVTVGDYYNDIEMLQTTPISACVGGSPKELQDICKIKLCMFEEGAIAELIEKLEASLDCE
ncbi:MAG: Cof-type HAD-IIB family hydrolase [Oscillospiraceae bacterium]